MSEIEEIEIKPILPVFVTDEKDLLRFVANTIEFDIRDPKKVMPLIFNVLIRRLRLMGIFAYPHRGMLYFIAGHSIYNATTLVTKLKNELNQFYHDVVKPVCGCKCLDYDFEDMKLCELRPASNISDFVIVRSLLYNYIRWFIQSKIIGSHFDKHGREGLTIYIRRIYSVKLEEDIYTYEYAILQGIRLFFEVTPRGRGRIWIDLVTRTRRRNLNVDEKPKYLSHHEMKYIGKDLYREYLRNARLAPVERLRKINEYLEDLGMRNNITVEYVVINPETRSLNRYSIVFKRLNVV